MNLRKSYMSLNHLKTIFTFLFFTTMFQLHAFELKSIGFLQKSEVSELEFVFDSNLVKASKFQVKEDKQIIVDFEDVISKDKVLKEIDASEFPGGIVYVKAYRKSKEDKNLRVAIQLRENVRSMLVRKPNRVVLQVENRFGVFSENQIIDNQNYKEKVSDVAVSAGKLNIPKSDTVEDILDNITLSGKKKYIGKKVTMTLKNVKPEEILRLLAETSGFNIIINDDVKKLEPVSMNIIDVPWDQALDTVLELNKLVVKKNGMILIVLTQEALSKELEAVKKNKEATAAQEPMLTKVFPISFASIEELMSILKEYSTEKRGKISKDSRTNSLIVKDTSDVIERMKKIVELLDTQTPQVLIESKIVEVSEKYSKEIGLDSGMSFGYDPFSDPSLEANRGSFNFSSAPSADRSLFGLSIGKFNRLKLLDFTLRLMESESKGKVISSPKVITKNNVEARIEQIEQGYFPETGTAAAGSASQVSTTWKSQEATIDLKVTPQVTNSGSISLSVELSKDTFLAKAAATAPADTVKRKIKTQVLVDNGNTVVIGGIYTYITLENHSGVPFLKDIPLVGWLFRTKYNPSTDKKELIIFLTPRVINQEEAGLVEKS